MIKGEFGLFGSELIRMWSNKYKSYANYLNVSTKSQNKTKLIITLYFFLLRATYSGEVWTWTWFMDIVGLFSCMCYHFYDLYYVMQILQFSHKLGSSFAQTDNHVGHCSTDHAHHAHAYEYVPPSADCNSNYIQAVSSRCIKLYPRISIGMNNNWEYHSNRSTEGWGKSRWCWYTIDLSNNVVYKCCPNSTLISRPRDASQ